MRLELEHTDNFSIQNNSSQERKMLPTTSPEDITPLVKKLSISASTELENLPINALVFKVSSSSLPSVVVPDPVSDLSSSRDFPSITERNPSSVSPSTHPHRSPPPLLNHTTPSFPPTLSLSTPMSPSCSTTRPSTISAEETLTLRDQPTPTLTDSLPRLSPPSLPPSDSMVPLTSMSPSSRLTWCHTHVSTLCFPPTPQLSLPRKPTTNSSPLLKSPTHPSSQHP